MAEGSPALKPFQVHTNTGVIHSGHMTENKAVVACKQANERVAALGITTTYTVVVADAGRGK